MIHLFSNVFLSTDASMSAQDDNVLLSPAYADIDNNISYEEVTNSKILFWAGTLDELIEKEGDITTILNTIRNHVESSNRRVVINADQKNAVELLAIWNYHTLNDNSIQNILKQIHSSIFFYNSFTQTTRSDFATSAVDVFTYDIEQYAIDVLNKNYTIDEKFFTKIKNQHSIEKMIATYLLTGRCGDGIVNTMQKKMHHIFDSMMYDLKEVILNNITKADFRKQLSITKNYDYSNIEEFTTGNTKIAKLMFAHPMWNYKYLSDFDMVDPSKMDDQSIADIKALIKKIEKYIGNTSILGMDAEKFNRVELCNSMQPEDIKLLLEDERSSKGLENLYFNITLRSINIYIMDYIIENYDNPLLLEELVLRDY